MTINSQLNQVKVEPLDTENEKASDSAIVVHCLDDEIGQNISVLNTSAQYSNLIRQHRLGQTHMINQPVDMRLTQLQNEEQSMRQSRVNTTSNDLNQRCAQLEKQVMELSKANAALTKTNENLASAVATAAQTVATITINQIAGNCIQLAAAKAASVPLIDLDTTNEIEIKKQPDLSLSCIEVEPDEHNPSVRAELVPTLEANKEDPPEKSEATEKNITKDTTHLATAEERDEPGKSSKNRKSKATKGKNVKKVSPAIKETTQPEQIDKSKKSPKSANKKKVVTWSEKPTIIKEVRKPPKKDPKEAAEKVNQTVVEQRHRSTDVDQVPPKGIKLLDTPEKIDEFERSLNSPKVLENTVEEMLTFLRSGKKPLKGQQAQRDIIEQYFDQKVFLNYTWMGRGKKLKFESYTNILKVFVKTCQAFDEGFSEADCIKYFRYKFSNKSISRKADGQTNEKKQATEKRKSPAEKDDDGASQSKRKKHK